MVFEALPIDLALNLTRERVDSEYFRTLLLVGGYVWSLHKYRKLIARLESLETANPMNIIQTPANFLNYYKGRRGFEWDVIIYHGMGGTLTGTLSWFRNPLAQASTQFCIGSPNDDISVDQVHQMVKLEDASGGVLPDSKLANANFRAVQIEIMNYRSVNKELVGFIKDSWITLTAELTVEIAKKKGRRPDRSWCIPHVEADPRKRECPKNIDVNEIVRRAQIIWDTSKIGPSFWGIDQPISVNAIEAVKASFTPIVTQVPISFFVVVYAPLGTANFRTEPRLSASVARTYPNGTEVECIETVNGDSVTITGRTGTVTTSRWYKSKLSGFYISAAVSIRK